MNFLRFPIDPFNMFMQVYYFWKDSLICTFIVSLFCFSFCFMDSSYTYVLSLLSDSDSITFFLIIFTSFSFLLCWLFLLASFNTPYSIFTYTNSLLGKFSHLWHLFFIIFQWVQSIILFLFLYYLFMLLIFEFLIWCVTAHVFIWGYLIQFGILWYFSLYFMVAFVRNLSSAQKFWFLLSDFFILFRFVLDSFMQIKLWTSLHGMNRANI